MQFCNEPFVNDVLIFIGIKAILRYKINSNKKVITLPVNPLTRGMNMIVQFIYELNELLPVFLILFLKKRVLSYSTLLIFPVNVMPLK